MARGGGGRDVPTRCSTECCRAPVRGDVACACPRGQGEFQKHPRREGHARVVWLLQNTIMSMSMYCSSASCCCPRLGGEGSGAGRLDVALR